MMNHEKGAPMIFSYLMRAIRGSNYGNVKIILDSSRTPNLSLECGT